MTGFGAGEATVNEIRYRVEIRALNSKGLDINLKLPATLRVLEAPLRQQLSQLSRGKIDCTISETPAEGAIIGRLNRPLMQAYYEELREFCADNQLSTDGILQALLHLPEVVSEPTVGDAETLAAAYLEPVQTAIARLNDYRLEEGRALTLFLKERVKEISGLLEKITPLEPLRLQRIRERLSRELAQLQTEWQADANRFEAEMIFYLEKLDISEEKSRLKIHCEYFLKEMLEEKQAEKGKKLGFIAQEMGREVNTIGSKANDAEIQQIVILMKDEIEKIKEQLSNIL